MSRELCLRFLFKVLDFFLLKKTGNFLVNILNIFSTFYRKLTRAYIENLRQSSLNSNVFNTYIKFELFDLYGKKDIEVQKIKVKKYIFGYISHFLMDLNYYFHKLYIN